MDYKINNNQKIKEPTIGSVFRRTISTGLTPEKPAIATMTAAIGDIARPMLAVNCKGSTKVSIGNDN